MGQPSAEKTREEDQALELDREAVCSLHEHWLPTAKAMTKPLKADRDLMAALEKAAEVLGIIQPVQDDLPY